MNSIAQLSYLMQFMIKGFMASEPNDCRKTKNVLETHPNPDFWHGHHPFPCSSRTSLNRHTLFCLHSDLFSAVLLLIMQNCTEFLESGGMLQL